MRANSRELQRLKIFPFIKFQHFTVSKVEKNMSVLYVMNAVRKWSELRSKSEEKNASWQPHQSKKSKKMKALMIKLPSIFYNS
jgi:hypothetical protein